MWWPRASRAGSSSRSCASSAAPTRRGFSSRARRRRRTASSISTARPSISPRGCRCSTRWKPPAAATASGRCKSKALTACRCARARAPDVREWAMEKPHPQCADAVLMVRPQAFGYNAETASTNTFQRAGEPELLASARELARDEFAHLEQALESEGISVCAVEDTTQPVKPDAVFPNNWLSFHADGTLVLYPIQSASRRLERRTEVIDAVVKRLGFRVAHLVDLTHHEQHGRFLEGTGSLVLDHRQRVAYACASPRTHPGLVAEWARELKCEPVTFRGTDGVGAHL